MNFNFILAGFYPPQNIKASPTKLMQIELINIRVMLSHRAVLEVTRWPLRSAK